MCIRSEELRRTPERDVDQLREPERSIASEARDRRERGAVAKAIRVQIGRAVADKQGGEHLGDDRAPHGPELDRDVIQGATESAFSQEVTCASDRM